MNTNSAQLLLAVALLVATCCMGLVLGSPFGRNAAAQAGEQDDGELAAMMSAAANKRGDETGSYEAQDSDLNDFGGSFQGAAGGYDQQEQADAGPEQHNNFQQRRPSQSQHQQQQAEASENSETNDDDDEGSDADDDSSSPAGEAVSLETAGATGSRRNAMAIARALAESNQAQPWLEGSGSQAHQMGLSAAGSAAADEADFEQSGPFGSDSNIANAKIELSPQDKVTAAGHHHHHGHHVHGMLKMGAETGKKGAFKWHDKHPVGGKGRR